MRKAVYVLNAAAERTCTPERSSMEIRCNTTVAVGYKSQSQIARVISESWCTDNLYCVSCDAPRLTPTPPNTPSVDFVCERCEQNYQVKCVRRLPKSRIIDSAYGAMMNAIRMGRVPNLLVLHYTPSWLVENLLVIPRFFFAESSIERRPPLALSARRAGWVGCNILLSAIPPDGRIPIIQGSTIRPAAEVRRAFNKFRGLDEVSPSMRGWTLDVLRVVKRLGSKCFTLGEVYMYGQDLQALHPGNQNIRAKVRQQLQVLRDLGFIKFLRPGEYEVR